MFPLILGIPLGIASSLVAWWILFHTLVPRVTFSPFISKTPIDDCPSGYRYRIKFLNIGRRDMIDTEVLARLRIKGIRKEYPTNWTNVPIPVGSGRWPIVRPKRRKRGWGTGNIFRLRIDEINPGKAALPREIKKRIEDKSILLEELLSLGSETQVNINIFCYDRFSGSRKVFESKGYRLEDIQTKKFQSKGVGPAE